MPVDESTDPPVLNEETPPLDAPVAVEWWYGFTDDGEPELDTHHGFHAAEHVSEGTLPAVRDGEFVTASGARVTADSQPEDMRESRYLYLTHRDALSRDIAPCVECFPRYATERRLDKAREGGILTEAGVEGAVFPVWIRADKESGWDLDTVHDSYTSLLYRAYAIRKHAGSVGGRLRYSLRPMRRCEYGRSKRLLPLSRRWSKSPLSGRFNRESFPKSASVSETNSSRPPSNTSTDLRTRERRARR